MKRSLILTIGFALIAFATIFTVMQIKAKKKYDEATDFFQETSVFSTVSTEKDDRFVALITREWYKHEGRSMSSKDLKDILDLAGFPNTLHGLVAFQTHVVPPYSYFNQERNKMEIIRAATMNVGSPIWNGEMVVSSTYVYHEPRSGFVQLFTMTDEGIHHAVYSESKEAEQ